MVRFPKLLILAVFAVFATTLLAAAEGEDTRPAEIADIELPVIIAPMIVNGRLESYAYLTIALTPSSSEHIFEVRSKVPYLQDAFLREVNRATIVRADDPKAVDTEALKARLVARMKAILQPGTVSTFTFSRIVVAPMRRNHSAREPASIRRCLFAPSLAGIRRLSARPV